MLNADQHVRYKARQRGVVFYAAVLMVADVRFVGLAYCTHPATAVEYHG
jgi:hypothetical protein